ncbi:DNA cytosine methyltransferase [Fibrella aquatica]|uniref:DNA cytosine methyltransferase n=1 Tax=Fibrella aquatica TaxID=3242487 RepID=UPI00351F9284
MHQQTVDTIIPTNHILGTTESESLRFIDLFAGLGGFHLALSNLKGVQFDCVFASELDPILRNLYKINYNVDCQGDIRKIVRDSLDIVPDHNLLCAGFPCQPFSKAGKQAGMKDASRGTLFDEIVAILDAKKPKYFILENVQFIRQHDNKLTWKYMERKLRGLGYDVRNETFSPQDFSIPQHRNRIFIVGKFGEDSLKNFQWMKKQKRKSFDVREFIDDHPSTFKPIGKAEKQCLDLWQAFIDSIPPSIKLPGFPIWSMEFGATYPFEGPYPFQLTSEELAQFAGNFGKSLAGLTSEQQLINLPSYARVKAKFPDWKKSFIRRNRQFYQDNKSYIHDTVQSIAEYNSQSWQKLEWNVGQDKRDIRSYILQFRASGIRVKKPDFFPSLVCTNTQTPIIGWQNRYITRQEGARLQSISGIELPTNDNACFKALGNAVNVSIVQMIAERLIDEVPKINEVENNHTNQLSLFN